MVLAIVMVVIRIAFRVAGAQMVPGFLYRKWELVVTVNARGKALYEEYSQLILKHHFQPMFREPENIPRELYPHIAAALYESLHGEDSHISRKCSVCEK